MYFEYALGLKVKHLILLRLRGCLDTVYRGPVYVWELSQLFCHYPFHIPLNLPFQLEVRTSISCAI